ncbi:hypothetical protein EDD18DRAFT_1365589 [Armillaria luteobubalina]|uniref:Uncharacterized protein n=1 Tax=Armillaria luteobubalina TaxID=153913 RepID=A0AA39P4K8_9AGAR|nr:hypothetical protein EDD18DRAFT_1365589 [Armillaria luteobubalina]
MDNSCGYNLQEATEYSKQELAIKDHIQLTSTKAKRGQKMKKTCQGRIIIRQRQEQSYICCEHYGSFSCKHFVLYPARGRGYNFDYLCALIVNDKPVISKIELGAHQQGYGPLMSCTTVQNISSVKVNCENGHRTSSKGDMLMTKMVWLSCSSRFTVIRPEDGYWKECPKILLICHSPHTHPIPLPTTTPVQIKAEIKALIRSLEHELADMTPRHFCRHPAVINRVKELCPAVEEPTVAHLHPLLANLDHIASYIHTEVKAALPHGTGWDGVAHMKRIQDEEEVTPYIRVIKRMSWHSLRHEWDEVDESDDEEGPLSGSNDDCFRLIAKGLGLHLQDIAREMGKERMDLHEPGRSLYSLGVYEHLHRILRICEAHITWGIASCAVPDYRPTLNGREELRDEVAQKVGVKASYRPTTIVVSVTRKYKRTVIHHTQKFNSMDKSIGDQNERLHKSWERYQSALHRLSVKPTDLNAIELAEKHKKAYEKHKQKSLDMRQRLRGQSSGRVRIVILE